MVDKLEFLLGKEIASGGSLGLHDNLSAPTIGSLPDHCIPARFESLTDGQQVSWRGTVRQLLVASACNRFTQVGEREEVAEPEDLVELGGTERMVACTLLGDVEDQFA